MGMDWFERLTGFPESSYQETRSKLVVEGCHLRSLMNGKSYGIGELQLPSLQSLRAASEIAKRSSTGRLKVSVETGDVRKMHQRPEFAGALFQVASQFNMLVMVSERVTPEDGVTRYQYDPTQGPACAIAAGAGTVYRNYFAPVGAHIGQTREHQLDGLAGLGRMMSQLTGLPVSGLWSMLNGYALCSQTGLEAINTALKGLSDAEFDQLRGSLCIGVHRNVEVTDAGVGSGQVVSQAYCSALPVAYSRLPKNSWKSFACLVLEAAYETTLLAAQENAERGGSKIVLLTRLGGGAFGNDDEWIHCAIRRALHLASNFDLDVRIVSYRQPTIELRQLVDEFNSD